MNLRKIRLMGRYIFALLAINLIMMSSAIAGANFILINLDGAGEGFNDTTAVAAVPGNSGLTLGQQRINAFEAAMADWGSILNSDVDIRVEAQFNALFCDSGSATLGQAGPMSGLINFANAPKANTIYSIVLANALSGVDNLPDTNDISATFNSDLDFNSACLGGAGWNYEIPSTGSLGLYNVVLHELGHGLNFLTFTDSQTGAFNSGFPDIYASFLVDQTTGKTWLEMDDAERAASAIGNNLFWNGVNAKNAGLALPLTTGQDAITDNIEIYAPISFESGSSVSHWNTNLTPDELMEPFSTADPLASLTVGAMVDMGWTTSTAIIYGDLDGDGCVGRNDVRIVINGVRSSETDPEWDFNGDENITSADARALVQLYTNEQGVCP